MIDQTETTLVAVWVPSIGPAEQGYVGAGGFICNKSARIRATSVDGQIKMDFPTGPLGGELLDKFQRLMQYGFTVIDVSASWVNEYSRPRDWIESIVNKAIEQVMQRANKGDGEGRSVVYNEALADEVLSILAPKYPGHVKMLEIKRSLNEEPNDADLVTTLQGLTMEGLIAGAALPTNTSGKHKLAALMEVHITKDGRQHMSGKVQRATSDSQIFHQYNVTGPVGAIGPHSTGTINYQQQWGAIQGQVDLPLLAVQLDRLRVEYKKVASSREDDKQIALLGDAADDAEKGNGEGMMASLSRIGTNVLKVAQDIGTDIAAKVILESTKG